jgi:putative ABC transport system ATP-binding protein
MSLTDSHGSDHTVQGAELRLSGVRKTYHAGGVAIAAMDSIDLCVSRGSMTAVTGASGSGKSTLLHLVGAIDTADAGSIIVNGQEITTLRRGGLARYRRSVGFVFQRYHLLPTLTALGNVMAPLMAYRTSFQKAARARELLAAVGLADRARSLPSQLSGGQQQRIAIARALVARPALLLADEPTGNLDSIAGGGILDLLAELRAAYGMTMLIATHERHVADRCDHVIELRDGQIVRSYEPAAGPAYRPDSAGVLRS